jgi:hypothetical protein
MRRASTFLVYVALLAAIIALLALSPLGPARLAIQAAPNGVAVACTQTDLTNAINTSTTPIDLPAGCTITLTSELPQVFSAIVINGNGAVINGGTGVRAFFVAGGGGNLTLNNVTIQNGNRDQGAGINVGSGGILTVNNSTITGNTTAGGAGGAGIYNDGGTVTVFNSTIANNSAAGNGGAIYHRGAGTTTVNYSTLSGNSATGLGGNLYAENNGLTVGSSIVANPGGGAANCGVSVGMTIADGGYNLQYPDTTCGFLTGVVNLNPALGGLANNGGLTSTMALTSTSPAVDVIPSGTNGCGTSVTADQRGTTRPQDGNGDTVSACDIGSFELASIVIPPTATSVPTGGGGGTGGNGGAGAGGPSAEDIARSQAPLCADLDGTTNTIIRARVPGGTVTNGSVYCRVLVQDSEISLQGASEVGSIDAINLGVIQAVDVFGMSGSLSVPRWNSSITACLQGSGRFFYLDALTAPRVLSQLPAWTEGIYTCATVYNAGTILLVH